MNCRSKNLIYLIICDNCSQFYVGETSIALNLRVNLHRNHINNENYGFLNVSLHIRNCGKSFKIIPFYKIPDSYSTFLRRKMEWFFIKMLLPELNNEH